MKRSLIRLLAMIVLAGGALAPARESITLAQGSQAGSLAGRVVDEGSGKPVQGATVTLTRYQAGEQAKAKTDADGSFTFAAVPAGDYTVSVTGDHYLDQEYGEQVPGWSGKVITLRSGQRNNSVNFKLARKGTISGTVLDQTGAPLPNVTIVVFTRDYEIEDDSGHWELGEVGVMTVRGDLGYITPFTAKTDASGRYRMEDLEPADYFVAALPRMNRAGIGVRSASLQAVFAAGAAGKRCIQTNDAAMSAAVPGLPGPGGQGGNASGNASLPQEIDLPIFYPDAIDPRAATLVHIDANANLQGIDLKVRPTPTATLTGTVMAPTVQGATDTTPFCANVALLPIGPGADLRGPQPQTPLLTLNASNRFKFEAVIPGTYKLVAVSGPKDHPVLTIEDIEVRPGGSQDITLTLKRVLDVPGQIIVDGPIPAGFELGKVGVGPTLKSNAELRLLFSNLGYFDLANSRSRVEPDGTFVLHNVLPEQRYDLGLSGWDFFRIRFFMVSMRYGDNESPGWGTLTAREGGATITIRLDFRLGRIEAVVMDQGKPKSGAMTVLLRRGRPDRRVPPYKESDAQGRVVFENVEPGDYDVYAWEDASDRSFGDFSMAQFKGRGQFVHVEKSGVSNLEVQVIQAERSTAN